MFFSRETVPPGFCVSDNTSQFLYVQIAIKQRKTIVRMQNKTKQLQKSSLVLLSGSNGNVETFANVNISLFLFFSRFYIGFM